MLKLIFNILWGVALSIACVLIIGWALVMWPQESASLPAFPALYAVWQGQGGVAVVMAFFQHLFMLLTKTWVTWLGVVMGGGAAVLTALRPTTQQDKSTKEHMYMLEENLTRVTRREEQLRNNAHHATQSLLQLYHLPRYGEGVLLVAEDG